MPVSFAHQTGYARLSLLKAFEAVFISEEFSISKIPSLLVDDYVLAAPSTSINLW